MPRLSASELAARREGMGVTDVLEALGLAPWEGAGPMRLYLAKTTPEPDDAARGNGAELEWGHVMEPVLLDWYARETKTAVLPGGQVPHRTESWLWATLDGAVLGHEKNIEIKVVGPAHAHHWDAYAEDGIPRYVRAQVTLGMECRSVDHCDVVATVAGRAPHIWTVAYDAELAKLLIDGGRRFWQDHVVARVPPPFDATPACREYLRAKYPSNEDRTIVEADEVADTLGIERAGHHMMQKATEKRIAVIDAALLALIGTRDGMRGTGWQMTWKLDKQGNRRQRFTVRGDE